MHHIQKHNKYNPNPITKIFCVILLGATILHNINDINSLLIVIFISLMFFINGFKADAIKNFIFYIIVYKMPDFETVFYLPVLIKMSIGLLFVIKMFYLPFCAGSFFIKTSDVGSIISSFNMLRIPEFIIIPIAVMFRFFPSFKEESKNIKMAMKIRGINTKNPIKYMEYVAVPLLILSSNIAEDIAKAAETKCIENPIKKNRYVKVSFKIIDAVYCITILILFIGGYLW